MASQSSSRAKIGAVVLAAIGAAAGSAVVRGFLGRGASLDKQLVAAANETNKTCPFMVDKDTRLDTTVAGPGKRMTYCYTLVNLTRDQIDEKAFVAAMRPTMVNIVKTNSEMEAFRKGAVTLVYNYRDKSGVDVASIEIGPADYGR